ncbi:hypothetical protein PV797_18620 [Clostridiaceae bacterium M8S5]|nr:hypothetical protein PV797_18620 [Clostridiaceae bacterium M8S5]
MKKRCIFVVGVILVLLTFSGCSSKEADVVAMIEKVEDLNFKLSTYNMDYDKFMEKIRKLYTSNYTEEELFNQISLGGIGLVGSKEEPVNYKSYYENQRKEFYEKSIGEYEAEIKISKAYDIKENIKNVFTKNEITMDFDGKETEVVLTKKYVVLKKDDRWKISDYSIDAYSIEKPRKLRYTNFNDKPVEYIKTLSFASSDE